MDMDVESEDWLVDRLAEVIRACGSSHFFGSGHTRSEACTFSDKLAQG